MRTIGYPLFSPKVWTKYLEIHPFGVISDNALRGKKGNIIADTPKPNVKNQKRFSKIYVMMYEKADFGKNANDGLKHPIYCRQRNFSKAM